MLPHITYLFILLVGTLQFSNLIYAVELKLFSQEQILAPGKVYGKQGEVNLDKWKALVDDNKEKSDLEKLKLVNDFFNSIPFVKDEEHWNRNDYWATPYEFLVSNGGDCEDYSLAKYFTLRTLGVHENNLKLAYIVKKDEEIPHMVLFYFDYDNNVTYILDNLQKKDVQPMGEDREFTIIYLANEKGVWKIDKAGKQIFIGPPQELHKLDDFLHRSQQYYALFGLTGSKEN